MSELMIFKAYVCSALPLVIMISVTWSEPIRESVVFILLTSQRGCSRPLFTSCVCSSCTQTQTNLLTRSDNLIIRDCCDTAWSETVADFYFNFWSAPEKKKKKRYNLKCLLLQDVFHFTFLIRTMYYLSVFQL